ncbi:lysophospholipid acyltransferase family protein [Candidatus Omnitrophota bacterium]
MYIIYRIGKFLSLHLPLRGAYGLAVFIAKLCNFFSKNDREAVKSNFRVLFPDYDEEKLDVMAKEVFINFAKYLVDFFRISKIDNDFIKKNIKQEGLEHLRNALDQGNGAIAATAHIGNWELGGIVLAQIGFPMSAVYLTHKDKHTDRLFMRQREIKGVNTISIGAALRKCFSVLKENYVLALVADRDYYTNGIEVDFFGKPTILPKGPAVFNRRFKSPIVPTFMVRNPDDTFILRCYEPIEVEYTDDEQEDLRRITQGVTHAIEKIIREYPVQWQVFRKFWEPINWGKES